MCLRAKSLQLRPTLHDPVGYIPPGSSVHGILQARILERIAMPSSRGSSQPRDRTRISSVSYIGKRFLYHWHHLRSSSHRTRDTGKQMLLSKLALINVWFVIFHPMATIQATSGICKWTGNKFHYAGLAEQTLLSHTVKYYVSVQNKPSDLFMWMWMWRLSACWHLRKETNKGRIHNGWAGLNGGKRRGWEWDLL